jgi:hypothetical protein
LLACDPPYEPDFKTAPLLFLVFESGTLAGVISTINPTASAVIPALAKAKAAPHHGFVETTVPFPAETID